MKRRSMTSLLSVVALGLLISGGRTWAVNGTAVSVAWRFGADNWGGAVPEVGPTVNDYSFRGALVRFDIQDNALSACDTIHHRSEGLAQYPALSFDGARAAFYRWGAYVEDGQLLGTDQPIHIAVVDVDGGNLSNLVQISDTWLPAEGLSLDWPVGDWVYYVTLGSQIRRVNVTTLVDEQVVWLHDGRDPSEVSIRRFSLTADAEYAGLQANVGNSFAFCFPPPDGNWHNCNTATAPGCNGALSTGGGAFGHYLYSPHSQLELKRYDRNGTFTDVPSITLAQAGQWMGVTFDNAVQGSEIIRWSANSEKWVGQHVGWHGHAGNQRYGSNTVWINWIDSDAFMGSNNPYIDPDPVMGGSGVIYYGNCTGDFWVSGGPAGCYEDEDGSWIGVGPSTAVAVNDERGATPGVSVRHEGDRFIVAANDGEAHMVQVIDPQGIVVTTRSISGRGQHAISAGKGNMPGGVYVVRILGATSATRKITLLRR